MSHWRLDYERIIREAGHRVTLQRLTILDAVCEGGGHTTLGHIYARVHAANPSIDRSTVYRTLRLFMELGLIVSAEIGSGEPVYEIAGSTRHHHLVCRQCGQETTLDDAVVHRMFEQIQQVYGFSAETDHLVLRGLCQNCFAHSN